MADQSMATTPAGRRAEVEPVPDLPIPEPILELQGIRAAYGSIEVLHGVDLTDVLMGRPDPAVTICPWPSSPRSNSPSRSMR